MTTRTSVIAVLIVALGATTACGRDPGKADQADGLVAEADVFSGRENPTWPVPQAAADAVAACVRTAAATDHVDPPSEGLGFRGIVVRGTRIDGDDNATVRVVPKSATIAANGKDYTIPGCPELYSALRDSAAGHVTPEVLDLIP